MSSKMDFRVRKRTSLRKDSENFSPSKPSVKRALFGKADTCASSKKARLENENIIANELSPKKSPVKNELILSRAKQVFHTCLPTRLIGRSKEISDIHCFLTDHINNKKAGSLYLSGAPGTGKTSSLMFVKKGIKASFSFAFINCMTLNTPSAIHKAIAMEFGLPDKLINSKNVSDHLKKHILKSKTMNVLVLDEIDHLDKQGQQILYSLFEWPHLPNSTLILIGIANALDLTVRILPLLNTFKYQPKLMHFSPYSKDEIVSILEDRLSEIETNGKSVIKPMAIQLCARKIAANTGDIRKALDVCRRALEILENKMAKQSTLRATSDDRCNPGSPMKRSSSIEYVDVQDINSVLHEVFGSRLQTSSHTSNSEVVAIPLQQKLLLCTLVLMKKHCKAQDMNVGKAYDSYRRICNKRNIALIDECAFRGLCQLAETRSFVHLKPSPVPRLTKVCLKMEESEVELVLEDKALLGSILADVTVLYKK